MRPDIRRALLWMAVFYIAMAYLEAAVVVYLRALYYPEGFDFPLAPMKRSLVAAEVGREAATMIMLLAPAAILTRSRMERFAWFCFGFGIWDIFYYLWLKVLINWPSSLMSRDLLFLIPVPWVGPVWAPCIISLGLIVLAMIILRGRSRRARFHLGLWDWVMLVGGASLMVISFTIDPLLRADGLDALDSMSSFGAVGAKALMEGRDYVPENYPWPWFVAGALIASAGIVRVALRRDVENSVTLQDATSFDGRV